MKTDAVYLSKLYQKFINTLIYTHFKMKIDKLLYKSFFLWKKLLNSIPLFFFFEAILKTRPVIGFYIYIIKTKNNKKIKILPYFMSFWARWQKAIYWISRSIKMNNNVEKLIFNLINELYNIVFLHKSNTLKQKMKFYKTILLFKTTKNYLW